jgi:hypothetical protein
MIQIISDDAEDILMRFHQHLSVRQDLSDVAIGAYISVARDFASWYESCTGRGFHLWAISKSAVKPYQAALQARGIPPAVIRRHLGVLRGLIDWSSSHYMPATRVS